MNQSLSPTRLRLWLFVLVATGAPALQACDQCWTAGGFPWFGYGNNGPAAYSLGNIPAAPYFALHPPVYYSRPVPRPYGQSPFAWGGDHPAPQRERRQVANPHVKPMPQTTPKAEDKPVKVAAGPRVIVNPYCNPELQAAR